MLYFFDLVCKGGRRFNLEEVRQRRQLKLREQSEILVLCQRYVKLGSNVEIRIYLLINLFTELLFDPFIKCHIGICFCPYYKGIETHKQTKNTRKNTKSKWTLKC